MLEPSNSLWLSRSACIGLRFALGLVFLLQAAGAVAQHGGNPQPMPASSLDPVSIQKYVDPLVIPPAIPRTSKIRVKGNKNID
jgi:hypothetical protein